MTCFRRKTESKKHLFCTCDKPFSPPLVSCYDMMPQIESTQGMSVHRGAKRKRTHGSHCRECVNLLRPILGQAIGSVEAQIQAVADSLQSQISALKVASAARDHVQAALQLPGSAGNVPLETPGAVRPMPSGHPLSRFVGDCLLQQEWSRVPTGRVRKAYLKWHSHNETDGGKAMDHIRFSRMLREHWPSQGCAARAHYTGIELCPEWR
jgi:hypothetical protein